MKKNHINYIVTFALLFIVGITNVFASPNIIDFSKKGSIDVLVADTSNDTGIAGVEVTIYKVGDAKVENSNLMYSNIDELKSCNTDFSTIDDRTMTKKTISCVQSNATTKRTAVTNNAGEVNFTDLDLGFYLVTQTNKVEGYAELEPFLVMLPQDINNEWKYDVVASPKVDITRIVDVSVKKIWNNEGNTNPKSIVVELLDGEEVVDTVTLSDENNWNHIWKGIELSDNYSVREKEVPEGYKVTYRENNYEFTITNTYTLPQTGLVLWKVELIAVLGISLLLIGLVLNKKNEDEN